MFDSTAEVFWKILSNPAEDNGRDDDVLAQLAEKYPQSNLLHLLLARGGNDDNIRRAAVYSNGDVLHKLVTNATDLVNNAAAQEVISISHQPSAQFSLQNNTIEETHVVDNEVVTQENNIAEDKPAPAEPEDIAIPEIEEAETVKSIESVAPEENIPETEKAETVIPENSLEKEEDTLEKNEVAPAEPTEQKEEALPEEPEEEDELAKIVPGTFTATTYNADGTTTADEWEADESDTFQFVNNSTEIKVPGDEGYEPEPIQQKPHENDMDDEVFDEIMGIEDIFPKEIKTEHPAAHVTEMPVADEPIGKIASDTNQQQDNVANASSSQSENGQEEENTPVEQKGIADNTETAKQPEPVTLENDIAPFVQNNAEPAQPDDAGIITNKEQTEPHYHPFVEQETEHQSTELTTPTNAQQSDDKQAGHEKILEDEIISSIVATDYFGYTDTNKTEETQQIQPEEIPAQNAAMGTEPQTMAKYHDDNLPYSFLWWLDKTRREHSNTYQPFAKIPVLPKINTLAEPTSAQPFAEPKKVDKEEIIERFIQEEPQIRPVVADKPDNENKARTSAEDADDLVTETLARIYTEQMLFHRAIETYKKLMLRFPEKSSYFAGQIHLLENRIN